MSEVELFREVINIRPRFNGNDKAILKDMWSKGFQTFSWKEYLEENPDAGIENSDTLAIEFVEVPALNETRESIFRNATLLSNQPNTYTPKYCTISAIFDLYLYLIEEGIPNHEIIFAMSPIEESILRPDEDGVPMPEDVYLIYSIGGKYPTLPHDHHVDSLVFMKILTPC